MALFVQRNAELKRGNDKMDQQRNGGSLLNARLSVGILGVVILYVVGSSDIEGALKLQATIKNLRTQARDLLR